MSEARVAPVGLGAGVSVVVPVYRSTDTLPVLVDRIDAALGDVPHEIVLVDDGSPSATWQVIRELVAAHPHVVGVRLGRNAGQHSALLAGVRTARHVLTATLDDDLQNPPEELPGLLAALTDEVDVVYGRPRAVAQRRWRRGGSTGLRTVMSGVLGVEHAALLSSYRVFRTSLRDGFAADLGPGVSLDALLSWSTSRFAGHDVVHHERAVGRSNYTFRRLLRFAIDIATGYSALPLQIATTVGIATSFLGVALLVWVLGRLAVTGGSTPGFPFLASMIAIFSGVQLMTLGIIGEYLARMHFRVMRRPSYVVAEQLVPSPGGGAG